MFLAPKVLGPAGLQPDTIEFEATYHSVSSSNPGVVLALDLEQRDATTYLAGGNGIFAHVQVPSEGFLTTHYQYGIFAIYMRKPSGKAEAISDGQRGIFRLTGQVSALVTNDGSADTLIGFPVTVTAKILRTNGDAVDSVPKKCVGWVNEVSAAADSSTMRLVTFNGLGIGSVYTAEA